jgi:hypothetical protein
MLIRIAHYSDAVKYGLVLPEFEFRPDGAIKSEDGGADLFMRDYLAACLGESIALDIDAYPSLFDETPADLAVLKTDETGFLAAFEAEFGLSLSDAAGTVHAMQVVAVESKLDVVMLRRSIIEAKLSEMATVLSEGTLNRFLKAFGLRSRSAWDSAPPAPFHQDDVWPWFFERRLSLMLRPVLVLSDEQDPILVYGIRQIDMGIHYASILLEKGIWPKHKLQSVKAQAYVDLEGNRRGTAFEQEIAKLVRDAGWRAFNAIPMRQLGAHQKLGDLDVLAVSPSGNTWIVIECKWFGAARTPREIANWLQGFHGHDGDKLHRHLQRFEWVQKHVIEIASALDLKMPANRIVPRIVTTGPVPLAFRANLPAGSDVWTRRELAAALKLGDKI